jgi:hypothetical protein
MSYNDPPVGQEGGGLAAQVGRLNETLADLGQRLRAAIAGAVSRAVADAVREAVALALGTRLEERPVRRSPWGEFRRHEVSEYNRRGDPLGRPAGPSGFAFAEAEWEEPAFDQLEGAPPPEPPRPPPGPRTWPPALCLASQALSWLKRRHWPAWAALAGAAAVGLLCYAAGPLLAAGAAAVSAAGLVALVDTAEAGASALALAMGP